MQRPQQHQQQLHQQQYQKPQQLPQHPSTPAKQERKGPVARKSTGSPQFNPPKGPRSLVAEEAFPGYMEGWEAPWVKKMKGRSQGNVPLPQQTKKSQPGENSLLLDSVDSPLDETLNQGLLALLLR